MNVKSLETVTLHLSSLPPHTNHASLYQSLNTLPGYKHVYCSPPDNTANIVLENRQEAAKAHDNFTDWASKEMIESGTRCSLVWEVHENERVDNSSEDNEEEPSVSLSARDQISTNVIDTVKCREVSEALIRSKCPVVMDFSYKSEDDIGLVMYVGQHHSYKLGINRDTLEDGKLGELMSSDCVKVINRLDSQSLFAAIKYFTDNHVEVNNVYDVNTAVKAVDYLEYGQSWFQQPGLSNKDLVKFLGLKIDLQRSQHYRLYMVYLELQQILPDFIHKTIFDLGQFEVATAAQNEGSLKAKYKKMDLKRQIDQNTVHIRVSGKKRKLDKTSKDRIVTLIQEFSEREDMQAQITCIERCFLVNVKQKHKIDDMIQFLETRQTDAGVRYTVTSTRDRKKLVEKSPRQSTDVEELTVIQQNNAELLQKHGLSSQL